MRYYKIEITDPDTGELIKPAAFKNIDMDATYTSYVNGKTLTAALNIELDIPIATYAQPRQGAILRIWGVSIQEISQASDLNFKNIKIYAGMQKGLPLAKPNQSGLIMEGTIFQAFGNWAGTDQTLDLVLLPPMGTNNQPVNLQWNWQANSPMSQALRETLTTGFPRYEVQVVVSDELKMAATQTGTYGTLSEFSTMVLRLSQSRQFAGIRPLGGGPYTGVSIVVRGNKVIAYDGTADYGSATFESPKKIEFEDMIGQPTWIGPATMNFRAVMRADLNVGDYIRMPDRINSPYVLTTPGAAFPNVPARDKSTFKGRFVIVEIHHFGNFRQGDAASWVTSINAVAIREESNAQQ